MQVLPGQQGFAVQLASSHFAPMKPSWHTQVQPVSSLTNEINMPSSYQVSIQSSLLYLQSYVTQFLQWSHWSFEICNHIEWHSPVEIKSRDCQNNERLDRTDIVRSFTIWRSRDRISAGLSHTLSGDGWFDSSIFLNRTMHRSSYAVEYQSRDRRITWAYCMDLYWLYRCPFERLEFYC